MEADDSPPARKGSVGEVAGEAKAPTWRESLVACSTAWVEKAVPRPVGNALVPSIGPATPEGRTEATAVASCSGPVPAFTAAERDDTGPALATGKLGAGPDGGDWGEAAAWPDSEPMPDGALADAWVGAGPVVAEAVESVGGDVCGVGTAPRPEDAVGLGLCPRLVGAPDGRPRFWAADGVETNVVSAVPADEAPDGDCPVVEGPGWKSVPAPDGRGAAAEKVVPNAWEPSVAFVVSLAALLRSKTIEDAADLNAAKTPRAVNWPPVDAGAASCGAYGPARDVASKDVWLVGCLCSAGENWVLAWSPAAVPGS